MEIATEGSEGPPGTLVSLAWHGHDVKRGTDVNARCIGVDRQKLS